MVLLRLRAARREHPADALQAGAQPERARRVGRAHQEAARRCRRARRRDARQGVHRLPQLGRGVPHRGDREGVRPARRAQAEDARGAGRPDARRTSPASGGSRPSRRRRRPTARRRTSRPRCCAATRWPAPSVDDGLKKFPDHWALLAADAGLAARREQLPAGAGQVVRLLARARPTAFAALPAGPRSDYAKARANDAGGRGDHEGLRAVVLRQPRGRRPRHDHRGEAARLEAAGH